MKRICFPTRKSALSHNAPSCPRPSPSYLAHTKSCGASESKAREISAPTFEEQDGADDDATRAVIEKLLQNPDRRDVVHSYSLHTATEVEGGLKLHLVLKFRYHEALIEEYFGAIKPPTAVEKRYGEAHRLFPYCIFNSIEESNISWTYQNNDGAVYERIELFATVTSVTYSRYHPHILKLLCLKVGSDGTAKTGFINLRPELDRAGRPNVDFGVFKKETSDYRIAENGVETGDVVRYLCRSAGSDSAHNSS